MWYTRLLGTALVEQLSREGRSVVYPSDVCSCYANVLDDKNCDQFYEACGSLEKAVINSLQRYTGHLESSATLDEIRVGLESIDPASIQRALQLLQQLGLVRQSRDSGGVRYSFTTEMYRQFFRSKGSTPDSVPSDDGQFLAPAQEKQSSSSMLEDLMADLL
ncbi:MAG: hypothetical protein IIV90_03715 [Oscillospiraceae bacterium]|nr:hypothetical protein [Oscillospiraceae bacterium]